MIPLGLGNSTGRDETQNAYKCFFSYIEVINISKVY